MTDIEATDAASELTPEERRLLKQFLVGVAASRSVFRMLIWLGGIATGIAAFAYYLFGAWAGWHNIGPHK